MSRDDEEIVSLEVLKEARGDLDRGSSALDNLAEMLCTLARGFLDKAIEEIEGEEE